ncbi:TerD family protein [Armatimonas sp.]|uniref:TerD family protein n=1 Tax=Armatimonas sp. TaxID=1872638 RepID=UPI00286CB133|nr:TerD family protein [Armatimonas sp.]
MNNALYLRRRNKILVPEGTPDAPQLLYAPVATLAKNVEALGFALAPEILEACRLLTLTALTAFYHDLIAELKRAKGAHQTFKPFWPNFPHDVMKASDAELYVSAILHYWTGGKYRPPQQEKKHTKLKDQPELIPITLGTLADFEQLFTQLAASNTSLSAQDREDIEWFVSYYGATVERLFPEKIPQKENAAFVCGLLFTTLPELAGRYLRTATDVLRLAVALSGGDLSLAEACKFRTLSRPERRAILGLLERIPDAVEDMLRWKGRWLRLGEKLHPGEFATRFPKTVAAFHVLRNDLPSPTFNSAIERALDAQDFASARLRLAERPGELARRLDHLLRVDKENASATLDAFSTCVERVSTPVLLQVRQHFLVRHQPPALRVFFPKGQVGEAYALPNTHAPLEKHIGGVVVAACEAALIGRFAKLPPLGRCYLDPALMNYIVPFATRSASKSLRTLVRGSRLPLPDKCKTLRFFIWWKNGNDRTDIDLSASLFDANYKYQNVLSYYNLKEFGGMHSGDIVDAPEGASEFIDVDLSQLREAGIRFVVMTLHSYTNQPYIDLPECFAGWMARSHAGSGEVFEPKTVQDRLDITANTRIAVPLAIDVVEERVLWCDLALRSLGGINNNVESSKRGIGVALSALNELNKADLYDLLHLHIIARGQLVETPSEAQTIFSVKSGLPYRQEEIASQFLL